MTDDFSTNFVKLEPAHCIKLCSPPTEEVIRLDKEGFHYRGRFIADAGEAHRLMVEFLRQQTQHEPQGLAMRRLLNAPIDNRGYVDLRERSRPEPQGQQGLIDEELTEFAEEWWRSFQYLEAGAEAATPITDIVHSWHFVDFSHAVLARWARPAIEPVPVAERLPGPEDCDAEGQCWWWHPDHKDEFGDGWILLKSEWAWGRHDADHSLIYTHWLPHHALPVPQQEAD
jgi:hypothetical protein